MTRFKDGPAEGTTLMLQRAPVFLRVVVDCTGKIDALDQPGDTPTKDETLHAYELTEIPGWCHVRKQGGGGFYSMGTYRLCKNQPTEKIMRDGDRWAGWCRLTAKTSPIAAQLRAQAANTQAQEPQPQP